MAKTTYAAAPVVAEIAAGLIGAHHPDLMGAPIVYLFRNPARKSHGRLVLGSAGRVTGRNAFLVALAAGELDDEDQADGEVERDHAFFVMEIAEHEWDEATPDQRAALVDHELCHMAVDPDDGTLSLRGHDLEEFNAVVHRHGLWRDDVALFAGICSTAGADCCVVPS